MILSHVNPEQSLEEHIRGMLHFVKHNIDFKNQTNWEAVLFNKYLSLCILFHDFGKATRYFQEYINSEDKRSNELTKHSKLSAIVAYIAGIELFGLENEFFLILSLVAIDRHHSNVDNVVSTIQNFDDNDKERLIKQAKSINYEDISQTFTSLQNDIPFDLSPILPLSIQKIENWVNAFFKEKISLQRKARKLKKEEAFNSQNYLKFVTLFSSLINADKNQAALKEKVIIEREDLLPNLVDNYKQKMNFPKSDLNDLRDEAYLEAESRLKEANSRVFSLNLPTGLGKTLIAYNLALKLRSFREKEFGYKARIIYSLPFISVIDQNFDIFQKVIEKQNQNNSNLIIKHHSSTELKYKTSDYEFDDNQAELLIEGWNAEIICTTFVQFFQTLLSNKNCNLRRFHQLNNSIIILDEIQQIPIEYWKLIQNLLLDISKYLNLDIILATATESSIFEENQIFRLCDSTKYFNNLNRQKYIIELEAKTILEFSESLEFQEDKTYLFIMNTISAAKDLYKLLKEKFKFEIGFLSTHIIPKQRLERIKDIKDKKYKVVVSTQLVEAGVDIDFDVVYRDLSPLDSIIQSAGRCNRNNLKKGEIHIVKLKNENNKNFCSSIYSNINLSITEEILTKYNTIEEKEIFQLIKKYFDTAKTRISETKSQQYLNAINEMYFDGEKQAEKIPISEFKLINEDYEKVSVFIEVDEKAKDKWEDYSVVCLENNRIERKKKFNAIKQEFYEYVINIPRKGNLPAEVNSIYYVSNSDLNNYYDKDFGFIFDNTALIW